MARKTHSLCMRRVWSLLAGCEKRYRGRERRDKGRDEHREEDRGEVRGEKREENREESREENREKNREENRGTAWVLMSRYSTLAHASLHGFLHVPLHGFLHGFSSRVFLTGFPHGPLHAQPCKSPRTQSIHVSDTISDTFVVPLACRRMRTSSIPVEVPCWSAVFS